MVEYFDVLQELGLTPVWRLRARYRIDVAPTTPHAAKEPALAESDADAVSVSLLAVPRLDVAKAPQLEPPQANVVNESLLAVPQAKVVNDSLPAVPQADAGNRAARIAMLDWAHFAADVSACTACGLARTRNLAVPGVGDPRADWLFVGEAPGAEEDAKGEPFVGQAGRLLDSMLAALGMSRTKAVYIANVLKCRPPNNRTPAPNEVEACLPYLHRQIALIQPKLIVALGKSAATTLLKAEASIASLRGRVHRYQGIPMIVTYHPAYLLRTLPDKAKAWEDLCLARATLLGILNTGVLQTTERDPT